MTDYRLRDLLTPPEKANRYWFQQRGRAFELVLNKMLSRETMEPRTSMRPKGEEIDGSFAIDNNFYLLEAKWHASPIPASALYAFKGKVDGKLIGTVGVFFSMSDYSTDAVDSLLYGKELNIILFGRKDLMLIEGDEISMRDAMRAKLRYAANYGQPFYSLETYLAESTRSEQKATTPIQNREWSILVESEEDVRTIQLLLTRFEIEAKFTVFSAGGRLSIVSLAESLVGSGATNVAAIITPISDSELQEKQINDLNSTGIEIISLHNSLEEWLENFISTDYYNATIMLTNRAGKMARRYARNADLEKLLAKTPPFSELIKKLGASPKNT